MDVVRARPRTIASAIGASIAAFVLSSTSRVVAEEAPVTASAKGPPVAAAPTKASDPREGLDPFPSTGRYLAYGFSFHSVALLSAGGVCPGGAKEPCVIGGGGGLSLGGAYRTPDDTIGAVYEATFHESSSIYQRGVLQQLRGEWRRRPRWFSFSDGVNGFYGFGAGAAIYGDNWRAATIAGLAQTMAGVEVDLGVKLALVVSLSYRAFLFRSFTDASGEQRPTGVAQFLGLELGLELHEPL
ncbi:MAG: hypothetical protein JNL79_14205 [Myxococcales bacterium]|nr:hypothetical protein [Myxococcales bacterium]